MKLCSCEVVELWSCVVVELSELLPVVGPLDLSPPPPLQENNIKRS